MGFLKSVFKHKLGIMVISKTTNIKGMITSRAEALYGCNRYYVQTQAGADMKLPDSYWFDEDDLEVIVKEKVIEKNNKKVGGPISKTR